MVRPPRREDAEPTRDHTLGGGYRCLVFIGERSLSLELPIGAPVVVGRGGDADLQLVAEGVSRRHARLDPGAADVLVTDLGSKNGTYVEGKRIPGPTRAGHGAEIRVGDARIVLSQRSAAGASARPLLLHGTFVGRLRIEVARALGFGRPISLLVVQLDRRCLDVDLARALASLRPVDVVGLYDDVSLELILPEVAEDEARAREVALLESLRALDIEAHAGAATLGGRGGSAEELLDGALGALRVGRGEAVAPPGEGGAPIVVDPVMKRIHEQLRRIAKSPISVLLMGETGVGKEVLAHVLHDASRRKGALVSVNAAALPEALLESELFGHERGAFTGATEAKEGLFERADGGTLFLDEVGELPLAMQAKLLRVLEDQRVRRVGAGTERKVDVRVVTATNADLARAVDERRFRSDLFFRLNGCSFVVPPLRERPSEIGPLAARFLAKATARSGRRLVWSQAATRLLDAHGWPGNVRELRNVVERAVALCEGTGGEVLPEHLPDTLGAPYEPALTVTPPPVHAANIPVRDSVRDVERQRIVEALAKTAGNQSKAAELLGLPRRTLSYRMEKLGIRPGKAGPG